MDTMESLERLGFGEYEARAYVALLQRGAVTGYELAKVSGIPRANIYNVLQKLEERTAVIRAETPDGTRYAPVPVETLLDRMEQAFRRNLDSARDGLNQLSRPVESGFVWSIMGYGAVIEHARALIAAAREHLLIGIYPEEAATLAGAMEEAEQRGVRFTTLCMCACTEPCGGCRDALYRYRVLDEREARRLLVVAYSEEMLAAEIRSTSEATAALARQPVLVELSGWFIRHSITLATLSEELGDAQTELLAEKNREMLTAISQPNQG